MAERARRFCHVDDPWAVLELPYNVDEADETTARVRQAVRRILLLYHPDKQPLPEKPGDQPQADAATEMPLWVSGGTCAISPDVRQFKHVTEAAAALRTHLDPSSNERPLMTVVERARRELAAADECVDGRQSTWAIRTRVCEILLEQEHNLQQHRAAAADPGDHVDPGDMQAHYNPAACRNRRKESKRARRHARNAINSMYRKPKNPGVQTCHLHIANTGPRFGVEAAVLARVLRDVAGGISEVTVTAPSPTSAYVYASFDSITAATVALERLDCRQPAHLPLMGRSVAISFAERHLPMVASIGDPRLGADPKTLSPAELLMTVRAAMGGTEDDEAGNIPEHRKRPPLVRCPLCSAHDAVFQTGRSFRMHLLSPAHSLCGPEVADVVEAAELLASRETGPVAEENADLGGGDMVGSEPQWLQFARLGDHKALAQLRAAGQWDPVTATDRHGSSALHWAAGSGHLTCMQWLVTECGVPADQSCTTGRADGRNALHWAARNGQTDACRWLVHRCSVPVDSLTVDDTTPFHWACWQRHFSCCRWLRDNGQVARTVPENTVSPFLRELTKRCVTAYRANVHAVNKYGCNGVHWAALSGNLQMCAWLAMVEVRLEQVNSQGHTALHKAAFKGHGAVVQWLLQHTAIDPGAQDAGGYTAGMVAQEQGYLRVAAMLTSTSPPSADGGRLPDATVTHVGETGSLAPRPT